MQGRVTKWGERGHGGGGEINGEDYYSFTSGQMEVTSQSFTSLSESAKKLASTFVGNGSFKTQPEKEEEIPRSKLYFDSEEDFVDLIKDSSVARLELEKLATNDFSP